MQPLPAAGPAVSTALKRRALSLGAAKAYEMATQMLLPVVLARCLDTATFGEYRLLWLVVGTVMALAPVYMPNSLFYFLPRSSAVAGRLYVHQVLLFLAGTGALGALAVSAWNPWLPEAARPLQAYGVLLPLLIALWVPAHLLDVLPTVDERAAWQARAIIALASVRTAVIALAALASSELEMILRTLVVFAVLKLAVLLFYISRRHGLGGAWMEKRPFADQLSQALPVGVWSILSALRSLSDQWIAAALFTLQSFAAFSIAAVLAPLVTLCRQAVNQAFLPDMSRRQAAGDAAAMLAINSQGNLMVASLLFPALGFAFVFAEELISLVYTAAYLEAAPVMRVYICGLAAMVVELSTLVALLRLGRFAAAINAVMLVFSVAASWTGATNFGLAGAAAGSVLTVYADRIILLRRISRQTGITFGRLQDWKGLALLLLATVLASALSFYVVERWWPTSTAFTQLCVGAAFLALAFLSMRRLLPLPR